MADFIEHYQTVLFTLQRKEDSYTMFYTILDKLYKIFAALFTDSVNRISPDALDFFKMGRGQACHFFELGT
jgi:hypothetical protein